MILMVQDYPEEHIIEGLENVTINRRMYYLSDKGEAYCSKEPYGSAYKYYGATRYFIPVNDDLTDYREVVVKEVETSQSSQRICTATMVRAERNGKEEIIIIHPQCPAFLCNNDGKTIKKLG